VVCAKKCFEFINNCDMLLRENAEMTCKREKIDGGGQRTSKNSKTTKEKL
jgi:hypothetical protein